MALGNLNKSAPITGGRCHYRSATEKNDVIQMEEERGLTSIFRVEIDDHQTIIPIELPFHPPPTTLSPPSSFLFSLRPVYLFIFCLSLYRKDGRKQNKNAEIWRKGQWNTNVYPNHLLCQNIRQVLHWREQLIEHRHAYILYLLEHFSEVTYDYMSLWPNRS